jgi:predicted secreted protein
MAKKSGGGEEGIRVKAGEEFEIVLESNPTTGYVWRPRVVGSGVELRNHHIEPGRGTVGGSARERFAFVARAPGEAVVEFALARPWEGEGHATEERKFKVHVQR